VPKKNPLSKEVNSEGLGVIKGVKGARKKVKMSKSWAGSHHANWAKSLMLLGHHYGETVEEAKIWLGLTLIWGNQNVKKKFPYLSTG